MSEFFDWDDTIENDDEFVILEEGDYDYKVTGLEKGYSKAQAPMATVTLEISGDGGTTTCTDYLVLQKNCEWKLSQFFRSIGQKKHGEPLKMDWSKVVGSEGRCRIYVDEYTTKEGKEGKNNKIERYYDPEPKTNNKLPW